MSFMLAWSVQAIAHTMVITEMAEILHVSIQVIRADEIKIRNRFCIHSLEAKGGAGLVLMLKEQAFLIDFSGKRFLVSVKSPPA